MWVVKLGGSLLGSPELEKWLEVFTRHGDGKVVIVPGGGIFADAVREAQKLSDFSDLVAHKMAVMAMDQYGVMMTGLNPKLATAASELEIAERGWQHRAIVWLPSKMVCADDAIPASWQVTSDSLAAWLAAKLNADHLILVKQQRPTVAQISVDRLIKDGMLDEQFGDFTAGQSFKTWVLGKADHAAFTDGISHDKPPQVGAEVRCAWN
ncbi:MAG: amino acid kinase family protein [Methylophilaceae bacterium]|jgi:aspartokinase-like uncharacterized kinase